MMKTAEVTVPFLFGKAEMTCPYCNHTTQHDREFKGRNGGAELSCTQCQKTFKVPKEFWPSYATVSESPRIREERIGFLGLGGEVTKVRCPYCKQDNEREKGFKDSHAGQQMRCDHCRDILVLPGKPTPKLKPQPQKAPQVTRQPVYQQPVYTPPPSPQKVWVTCQQCSGNGQYLTTVSDTCGTCGGKGQVFDTKDREGNGVVQSNYFKCRACRGSGWSSSTTPVTCRNCQGKGGWHQ